jgi:hypothetical protein
VGVIVRGRRVVVHWGPPCVLWVGRRHRRCRNVG